MPYIPFEQRKQALDRFTAGAGIPDAAELSYIVAAALDSYAGGEPMHSWDRLANGVKAVESALDEFKRATLYPYEDEKRKQNGDVFVVSRRA